MFALKCFNSHCREFTTTRDPPVSPGYFSIFWENGPPWAY